MLTKQLGTTSIPVRAVGLGTGDGFWNSPLNTTAQVNLLRTALDLGLNLIDTAEGYGQGFAEEVVGKAIRGIRESVIVATKFSPEHSDRLSIMQSAEASLRRLETDYIDLYQVHWPNPRVPLEETMQAMRHLVESGKVRAIGLGNVAEGDLLASQQFLGSHRVSSVQTEYNLFERTIEHNGLLKYCEQNNIIVLAYSSLDQGRFAQARSEKVDLLKRIAEAHNKMIAQVVLRWLLHRPAVVALTRTTKQEHLIDNVRALEFHLTPEEVALIDRVFEVEVIRVLPSAFCISREGEWGHSVYNTLDEAMENRFGFVPSPCELARAIAQGQFLKPVRVIPSKDSRYDFELIGGRIRYWAWIIARGEDSPIPAIVRDGL